MSDYNIKANWESFIETGAYLARDLIPFDEVTDLRVEGWRTAAMSLVRIGKPLFIEINNRDKRIAELEGLLTKIAGVVHHGGLLNLNEPAETTVRRLTLDSWDKQECDRLCKALEVNEDD